MKKTAIFLLVYFFPWEAMGANIFNYGGIFNKNPAAAGVGVPNNALIFNGQAVVFNGLYVTFTHS